MDSNKRMKIGILGGTFNPIHCGHIQIALSALKEYTLDKILIMPSGLSYFKEGTGVLPPEVRCKMVQLAVDGYDKLICDDREQRRQGNSYTCDTIKELDEEYKDNTDFYYIIGADTLLNIHLWKDIKVIFDRCIILVAVRSGAEEEDLLRHKKDLEDNYSANILFLHCPAVDVSSSMIREYRKAGKPIDDLVPPEVEGYIIDNGLYL